MQNSLSLRQQHFLYQRKNLYNQEPLRSSSGEIVPENLHRKSHQSFLNNYPSPGILYPYRSSLKYGNPSAAGG